MQVLQLYPEVRRTIEEAKQRREAETKAASSVMEEELARSSTRPRKRNSYALPASHHLPSWRGAQERLCTKWLGCQLLLDRNSAHLLTNRYDCQS